MRTPAGAWTAAYGKADPATGAPMRVGMHTRVGSITKTFTGTLILQLAEAGKLSLDDPIEKYVPGVPNGSRISLRQLANMTSGVASYTRSTKFNDVYFAKPETIFDPATLLAVGISESPLFEPGARFDYSNTNFILLGMVIEKVSGETIDTVFRNGVLKPLGLSNTSWPGDKTELPSPYAEGFTLQGDYAKPAAPSNATHWNPAWGRTAGEMISDMADLLPMAARSARARASWDPLCMRNGCAPSGRQPAMASQLGCIDGWVGHTGELPGYNTTVFYDTTRDTTVIVQANSDIASGQCSQSPVLANNPVDVPCLSPATRVFAALSTALGHSFTPLPQD